MWPYPELAGKGCRDGCPVLVEDVLPSLSYWKVPERGGFNGAFHFFPASWVFGGHERSHVCEGREEGHWGGVHMVGLAHCNSLPSRK